MVRQDATVLTVNAETLGATVTDTSLLQITVKEAKHAYNAL